MNFNFCVKSNIIFGIDSIKEIGNVLGKYDLKKIMLVYDAGVKFAGISDLVLAEIEKMGLDIVVFDKVIPNPTNEVVEEGALIAKESGVDGFVAVGGGSSIDLAKAINVLVTNIGKIGDYAGIGMVKNPVLPLIAIPTTAGTSSEITNVSALIDTEKVIKYVVIDDKIIASDVIADPVFTRTMPQSVTAATGMDAITHAVESYISNMASPLTEYNSLKALDILFKNIVRVVEDGNDLKAREQMMLGCIIGGFAFSNANLGMVHAIAHTLSAHFGLAHGMANAAVLPYVMEYNSYACPDKMIQMAKYIGLDLSGNKEEDKFVLSKALLELNKKLGIKTLSQQGISREDFDILAEDTLKEPVLNFNPRSGVEKSHVLEILEKAF